MIITVELSKKEIQTLKDRQTFQMQWIQAGMDEKEPFDFVVQKVLNAAMEAEKNEINPHSKKAI